MMAERDCQLTCACRAVTVYISAAQRIGWDLAARHLFAMDTSKGGQGSRSLSTARRTAFMQIYLREAGLPNHFTMPPIQVGVRSRLAFAPETSRVELVAPFLETIPATRQ